MIDTDKYKGHTENKWVWYEFNDGDWILCPLHDDVKPDPDDLWWGVDEETGEPLETHAALNWDERILDLSSDCMTGNNNPTRKDFVYCSHSSGRLPRKRVDMNLIQDAPLLLAEVKRLREEVRWLRDTVCLLEDSRITNMSIHDRPELFADVAEVFRQRNEDTHGHLPPFEGVEEE